MSSINDENRDEGSELIQAAEKIVSTALGRSIPFTSMERLTDPERRNAVYRCFCGPGERAGEHLYRETGDRTCCCP